MIHYAAWFLRKKKFFILDFLFFIPSTLTLYFNLIFIFVKMKKILNWRVIKIKLKLIFPALRTPFSFQAFARSPRSKSRRVLDLKLLNNSMSSPDYPDILGQS